MSDGIVNPLETPEAPAQAAAEAPTVLQPGTAAWYDEQIAAHEVMLQLKYSAVTATREYAEWQHEGGKLQALRELRDLLVKPEG